MNDMSNEQIIRRFINTARAIVIESGCNHFEVDFTTGNDEKYVLQVDLIKVDDTAELEEEEKEKTEHDY